MASVRHHLGMQAPAVLPDPDRECGRKLRYSTKQRAAQAARRALRERGEWLHAYFCRRCGGWHIGHMPARRYIREHSRRQTRLMQRRLQEVDVEAS